MLPLGPAPENPNPAFVAQPPHKLLRILEQFDQPKFDLANVSKIIEHNCDQLFEIPVTVDRICNSEPELDDPAYSNGKTIFGRFAGTQIGIAVQLPCQHNQKLESLSPGGLWSGIVTLIRWDACGNHVLVLGI